MRERHQYHTLKIRNFIHTESVVEKFNGHFFSHLKTKEKNIYIYIGIYIFFSFFLVLPGALGLSIFSINILLRFS